MNNNVRLDFNYRSTYYFMLHIGSDNKYWHIILKDQTYFKHLECLVFGF